MLNLVIAYDLRIKNSAGVWVDDHFDDIDSFLGFSECFGFVANIEEISRDERIRLFEKVKKSGDKLNQNVEEFFECEVREKHGELSAVEIEKLGVQALILTDQEMIKFDKKRVFDGKQPIKQIAVEEVFSSEFEIDFNIAVGKRIDAMLKDELKKFGTEMHSTNFAIWAQVHKEFKNAPKKVEIKNDDTRGYRTLGERFVDSFEERDDLSAAKEQTFGDID